MLGNTLDTLVSNSTLFHSCLELVLCRNFGTEYAHYHSKTVRVAINVSLVNWPVQSLKRYRKAYRRIYFQSIAFSRRNMFMVFL